MVSGNTTIGILGGGQLARMSAFAAFRLGFDVSILERFRNSPAGMLTKHEYIGTVGDRKVLNAFLRSAHVFTLENEFIDHRYLSYIEESGKKLVPSSKTISLIQDKLIQKQTLKKFNIPVPRFLKVDANTKYSDIAKLLGRTFLLKSRKMGYDGYGNANVDSETVFEKSCRKLSLRHSELMAEEFVDFEMELAIMVVRTRKETQTYPLVQTFQVDHICHTIVAPAPVGSTIRKQAEEIAIAAVESVKGYGIFGIEFFLEKSGRILVNEMAPRPHNSGHYTIEACVTSQFENHIRSVLNLPLGSTEMVKPYAVMVNILGKRAGTGFVKNYDKILIDDDIHLHIYGKEKSRNRRKMGHITLVGENLESILERSERIAKLIKI
ncbi:MAG: 5-(carboxyamino)imidazole ribonucleotide synthase [Candidatus Kryptoniota bacterium]